MIRLKFAVIVEKDEAGYYVASVTELSGCHTQAKTPDKLMVHVKEAIEAYLKAIQLIKRNRWLTRSKSSNKL